MNCSVGLLLSKLIYGLPDESVCERWACDPYFQHFMGEEFFQHGFTHHVPDLAIGASGSAAIWTSCPPKVCGRRMGQ